LDFIGHWIVGTGHTHSGRDWISTPRYISFPQEILAGYLFYIKYPWYASPDNDSQGYKLMSHQHRHIAFFAAGCFWGVQDYFDQVPGVLETEVGYSGGTLKDPSYEDVISEKTGHAETVKVVFDPMRVSYHDLVRQFFRMHDPTQLNRQGYDIGPSYRSAIFYMDAGQQKVAEIIKAQLEAENWFDKPIMTEITAAGPFYPAEAYHQKFTKKTGRGACRVPYAPLS